MLQVRSHLDVADNTGAKVAWAIGVLGRNQRYAHVGDVIKVHIKDAVVSDEPGTWGREVVVGTGQVDWPAFLGVLAGAGVGAAGASRSIGARRAGCRPWSIAHNAGR